MLRRYLVLNSKGGCGKTTIASNLASYYAMRGEPTALFDYDPQGSATRWLDLRPQHAPLIYGINAVSKPAPGTTRAFQLRIPPETEHCIIDTPASLKRMELMELLRNLTAVIVPVLPSAIDAHTTERFLVDLHQLIRTGAPGLPVALVGNRLRGHQGVEYLQRLTDNSEVPLVAKLRDSVNYLRAADTGIGIAEIGTNGSRKDSGQWNQLVRWLEQAGNREPPGRMARLQVNLPL